jgi:hypothetical protein
MVLDFGHDLGHDLGYDLGRYEVGEAIARAMRCSNPFTFLIPPGPFNGDWLE